METELHNAIHHLAELAYEAGAWAVLVLSVVALLIFVGETARTIFRRETGRRPDARRRRLWAAGQPRRPRHMMI
jgi:hypothetical protein